MKSLSKAQTADKVEQAVLVLHEYIIDGGLEPGDLLPSESEMVKQIGVSIVRFATFMTGEIFAALIQHIILGRLITENDDPNAFTAGVHEGFSKHEKAGGILSMLCNASTGYDGYFIN